MIGRKKELAVLQRMAGSRRFEFLVMYGRRRVGKTTILQEFAKGQPVIFFPAQEKNDALNLQDFSQSLQEYFADAFLAPFPDWERAFAYFGKQAAPRPEKTILIIDEFPFLAAQNASIKSILQHAIDHAWQQQNIMLVLCGSSVSFMVNDVMGYKSPLYGRITGQMEVLPFDYFDSASFFHITARRSGCWHTGSSAGFLAISMPLMSRKASSRTLRIRSCRRARS